MQTTSIGCRVPYSSKTILTACDKTTPICTVLYWCYGLYVGIVACNTGPGSYIKYHHVTIIAPGEHGAIHRIRCDAVSITGVAMHHCYSFSLIQFYIRQSNISSNTMAFGESLKQMPRLPSQYPIAQVNYRLRLLLAAFRQPNNSHSSQGYALLQALSSSSRSLAQVFGPCCRRLWEERGWGNLTSFRREYLSDSIKCTLNSHMRSRVMCHRMSM